MNNVQQHRTAQVAPQDSPDELRRIVYLLRQALDANPDNIFVKDLEGKYLFMNEAGGKRFGRPVSEMIGLDASAIFDPQSARKVRGLDRQVMETGQPCTSERTLRLPGGEPEIFLASRAPFRDADGAIIGVIGISRNITEQRRLEEVMDQARVQIAHLSRLSSVGEIASHLAHELNQPLTAILSYAEVCLEAMQGALGPHSKSDVDEHLHELSKEAKRAAAIISRLRSYICKQSPHRRRHSIHYPLREALGLMRFELERSRVKLQLDFARGLPQVEIDPIQIQQVIINLIQNALDAMVDVQPSAKFLRMITDAQSGETVRVRMIDAGSGVPEAIFGKIFDSFFTTKPNGLGLGLPICRSIIESHGGCLGATPNADRGMTFEFVLPSAVRG
jgi:PAS domain S-box-containing protein